ncbi:MAG: trypsin-like serine protease, partial [Myxococcales bacterium]
MPLFMKRLPGLALLTLGALSCAVADRGAPAAAERAGQQAQPLINGLESDASQDYTMLIQNTSGGGLNEGTGTLVAPNLVLTALHIVANYDQNFQFGAVCVLGETNLTVYGLKSPKNFKVHAGTKYPGSKTEPAALVKEFIALDTLSLCDGDMAFLVLDRDLTDRPIAPIRLDGPPTIGNSFFTVGWGLTTKEGLSALTRKTMADMPILALGPGQYQPEGALRAFDVFPSQMLSGSGPCYGDSGGGAFDTTTKAVFAVQNGIDNTNPNAVDTDEFRAASCIGATSFYTRTDRFRDQIIKAFKTAGHAPWRENKPRPAAFGEACAEDLDCDSQLCVG